MPSYIIEPHPVKVPELGDAADITARSHELCNANMLLREMNELEARLPGAVVRGIVLTAREEFELRHTLRENPFATTTEFCGTPVVIWKRSGT